MNAPLASATPAKKHPVRDFFRKIGPAGPVALIATAMPVVGAAVVGVFVPHIVGWLHRSGALGMIVFALAFAILGGFALVPTWVNSTLAGWTFKFPIGFPITMAGLAGAATIGYALAHRIIGHRVRNVIHEHPKWEVVRDALVEGSTLKVIGIVTLLRLSPVLPFETSNVLLASCEVRLLPYLIGTLLGVAPRTAAIVLVASKARKLEMGSAQSTGMIIAGIIVTILVVVVIAIVARHALHIACAPTPKGEQCDVPSRQ
jgi:uncharacterized membrane protein YdjX (TVP38/TMEM64 family)